MFHSKIIAFIFLILGFFMASVYQIAYENNLMAMSKNSSLSEERKNQLNLEFQKITIKAKSLGFKPSSLKNKVTIVNFWAAWCSACLEEFPSLVKINEKYPSVEVIGANQDPNDEDMKKSEKKNKLNFFSFRDLNTEIADRIGLEEYPYSAVYCNGEIVTEYSGATDFSSSEMKKIIEACK